MAANSYGAQAYRRERNARAGNNAFSFRQLVADLEANTPVRGYNAEILTAHALACGRSPELARPTIPLDLLMDPTMPPEELINRAARNMTAAGVAGSQFLVGQTDGGIGVLDRLRAYSLTAQGGVNMIQLPGPGEVGHGTGSVAVPLVTGGMAWTWLSDENTPGVEDQPVLGLASATPRQAIGLVKISRQLLTQASNAETVIRDQLLRGFGETLDVAILSGSGVAGEPLGLLNTPGIITETGAGIDGAKVLGMERQVVEAGAQRYAWLAGPVAAATLKGRADADATRTIWRGALAAGDVLWAPAFSSTNVPSATAICGPWSSAYVILWGGLTVGVDRFTNFKPGHVLMRLLVPADVIFGHVGAFAVATGLS